MSFGARSGWAERAAYCRTGSSSDGGSVGWSAARPSASDSGAADRSSSSSPTVFEPLASGRRRLRRSAATSRSRKMIVWPATSRSAITANSSTALIHAGQFQITVSGVRTMNRIRTATWNRKQPSPGPRSASRSSPLYWTGGWLITSGDGTGARPPACPSHRRRRRRLARSEGSSGAAAGEAVLKPEPFPDEGQEPGMALVRRRHEREAERGQRRGRTARDPFAGRRPERSHHRDARAAAAERVGHAVLPADMRHPVEREADVPAPRIVDAIARELRMDLQHALVEDPVDPVEAHRQEARPAAEDHPAVLGDVPVVEEVLRVEEGPTTRRQRPCQLLGERLRGNDVAADRDDASPERRDRAIGVSVRPDDDLLGQDRPTLGLDHQPAVALASDGRRPDALVEVGAGGFGGADEAGEVLARVEQGSRREDDPAVVERRADLVVEILGRHERRLDAELPERLDRVAEMLGV